MKHIRIHILEDTNKYVARLGDLPFFYNREVIIRSEFGENLGFITSIPFEHEQPKKEDRQLKEQGQNQTKDKKNKRNPRKDYYYVGEVIRYAQGEDKTKYEMNLKEAVKKRNEIREMAKKLELNMNITYVLQSLDNESLGIFYTAPERVDFRELLKQLRDKYQTKIILRQIYEQQRLNSFQLDARNAF